MRKYLKHLSTKSKDHKRRFAFLFSSIVTAAIFLLWMLVMFGPREEVADSGSGPVNLSAAAAAPSPFNTAFSGIGDTWYSLTHLNSNGR